MSNMIKIMMVVGSLMSAGSSVLMPAKAHPKSAKLRVKKEVTAFVAGELKNNKTQEAVAKKPYDLDQFGSYYKNNDFYNNPYLKRSPNRSKKARITTIHEDSAWVNKLESLKQIGQDFESLSGKLKKSTAVSFNTKELAKAIAHEKYMVNSKNDSAKVFGDPLVSYENSAKEKEHKKYQRSIDQHISFSTKIAEELGSVFKVA